jgi:hypothetical protein
MVDALEDFAAAMVAIEAAVFPICARFNHRQTINS